jgi:hypothetical protein
VPGIRIKQPAQLETDASTSSRNASGDASLDNDKKVEVDALGDAFHALQESANYSRFVVITHRPCRYRCRPRK